MISVTNNLQVQDVYSIRGLNEGTPYDLKVTAHNHAGSTTQLYQFTTLNAFGNPALPRGGLATVLHGLGFRATLSIIVSVLCLVLASAGVCFCIRKSKYYSNSFNSTSLFLNFSFTDLTENFLTQRELLWLSLSNTHSHHFLFCAQVQKHL